MTPAARVQGAIEILDAYLSGQSAEQALSRWCRSHRFAGSKDRAALRDLVFDALRCRASYAWLGGGLSARGLMVGALRKRGLAPEDLFNGQTYAPFPVTGDEIAQFGQAENMPDDVALDMPGWLFAQLQDSFGEAALGVCAALQQRAPVDLRVNTLKASVGQAEEALYEDGIATERVAGVATALRVVEGARSVVRSRAFTDGLVELQDAASQLAVLRSPVPHKGRILDFCAGGGGKALALAAGSGGCIHVHDANLKRMRDLPDRAARAGADLRMWNRAEARAFDLVFCDAPCSGSGTWRRSPEAKWTLTPDRLAEYVATQRTVLTAAAPLVRPGGFLVYATCSILTVENAAQTAWFLQAFPAFSLLEASQMLPENPGDGFYFGILRNERSTKG